MNLETSSAVNSAQSASEIPVAIGIGKRALSSILDPLASIGLRKQFMAEATRLGYEHEDALDLWTLSRFLPVEQRVHILNSPKVFESCAAKEELNSRTRASAKTRFSKSRLAFLRRLYILRRRTPKLIAHTRQIERNQQVTLHAPDGARVNGVVATSNDNSLRLVIPVKAKPIRVQEQQPVRVSFARSKDARYEFASKVTDEEASSVDLSHASVTRIQQRAQMRVRCNDEIAWARLSDSVAGQDEKGALRDLSAGGACFITGSPLQPGENIKMHIRSRRTAQPLDLDASVVRQTPLKGTSQTMYQTSIRFKSVDSRHEYLLARMVNDIQRNMIQRMLARAGQEDSRTVLGPISIPVQGKSFVLKHSAAPAAALVPESA